MLLQAEITDALRNEIGLRDEFARPWAAKLTAYLQRRLGTQNVYIPAPGRAERDAAIFREFDGKNVAAVMKRYDVSRSRLYQIIEEQRALLRQGPSPVSSLKTGQAPA